MSAFELTITAHNGTDSSSGIYDSYADSWQALHEAADIDALYVYRDHFHAVDGEGVYADGVMVDTDGVPWFDYQIKEA